jgi:hypothetical protein
VRRSRAQFPPRSAIGQPPAGTRPCEASPPPIPCSACGGCGGGAFEPPPPLVVLGAGDEATGSRAGWIGAGLRCFVAGARANEGSLTAAAGGALCFSGFSVAAFFVFRLFPCAPPAATGETADGGETVWGECWGGTPPSAPEDRPAPPKLLRTTARAPPKITSMGIRTAIARRRSSPSRFQIRVRDEGAPVPGSVLSAVASRVNVSVLGDCPSSMRATLAWLVSILAARSSWLSPSPARRTATSRPKISSPLLPDLLPASTDLSQEAGRRVASTAEDSRLSRN